MISLFFRKMTAKVSRNNYANTALGLKIPLIYFRHLRVSWVKAYQNDTNCPFVDYRAVGTAAAMAAALFGLSVFLFTENPLKCFIL